MVSRTRTLWPIGLVGLFIWAAATAALRCANIALVGESVLLQVLVYVASMLAIVALVTFIGRRPSSPPPLEVAAALALPGMFLDIPVVHFWSTVFPNLPAVPGAFGALMLWCYGVAILTGLLARAAPEERGP